MFSDFWVSSVLPVSLWEQSSHFTIIQARCCCCCCCFLSRAFSMSLICQFLGKRRQLDKPSWTWRQKNSIQHWFIIFSSRKEQLPPWWQKQSFIFFFSFLVDLQISNNHSSLSSDSEAESNLKTCVPHHFTSSSSSSSCRATYLSSSFHIWRQSLRFFFSLPSSFKSLLSSSRSFSTSKCESRVSSVFPAILSFSLSLISPFTVSPPLSISPRLIYHRFTVD